MGTPFLLPALQRRPKLLILVFTVSVLFAVAALQAAGLWWWHDRIMRNAESRASNFAFVLAEYMRGSFAVADASLRQLVIHAGRVGGPNAPAAMWDPILDATRSSLPGSGSISVTGADGIIRRSTIPEIVGQSRADLFLFKQLSSIDRDELVVDRPFVSPIQQGRFLIPIGRRLVTADGRFNGAVVAVVMPEAFREFFKTVDVGYDGIISVFHPDGVVLFREPSAADPIGEQAQGHPLLQAAQRGGGTAGIVRGPLQPGGQPYVSAYRTLATSPPLIVGVSFTESGVLSDWQRQITTSVLAFLALTLTLALMVRVLFKQIDARATVERELGEVQRLEASRLRDTNERLADALEREQKARRESDAASYLKDEFLMTVSHELRTPLTAIYGWVRMLGSEGLPAEQRERALAAIERNARAQTRLIDDLLDVSRAISGKLRLVRRRVNVADVVLAAVETLKPALDAKSIRFESSFDRSVGGAVVDPDRLQQIVWNLLSNAIKFTPEGGIVRLTLARASPGDSTSNAPSNIEIAVTDSGVGIDPEFLPYVFERFRQAEAGSRRRYGGLGLGLAIVRHLAELHGGTVSAESAGEGKGATFRVVLPVRATTADVDPDPRPAPPPPAAAGRARLDGIRVLVVDDDADARELFTSILERAGATVLTAGSAADALGIIAAGSIRVLVSDIEMPGQDGYELLQLARAEPDAPPFLAIAVTAYARPVDRHRALQAGFDWHLSKPIEPSQLLAAIASLIG